VFNFAFRHVFMCDDMMRNGSKAPVILNSMSSDMFAEWQIIEVLDSRNKGLWRYGWMTGRSGVTESMEHCKTKNCGRHSSIVRAAVDTDRL